MTIRHISVPRYLFLSALPVAMCATYLCWLLRLSTQPADFLRIAVLMAVIGILAFPTGLLAYLPCFGLAERSTIFVAVGLLYGLYVVIAYVGWRRPTLWLFLLLALLLTLNAFGCHNDNLPLPI